MDNEHYALLELKETEESYEGSCNCDEGLWCPWESLLSKVEQLRIKEACKAEALTMRNHALPDIVQTSPTNSRNAARTRESRASG